MNEPTHDRTPRWKRRLIAILGVLAVLAVLGAWFTWEKFFREGPPQTFTSADERFKYGSIGAEDGVGIPYWIWYVLPRVFPDKLPGPGGYASFGMPWEPGKELPVGFTKKRIGFDRVANNCATCHTASYRERENQNPIYVPTGGDHTFNLYAFFRFLVDCAKDPRFNSRTLMNEIELSRPKELSWTDRQIYRFILIPLVRKQLLARETQFAWLYNEKLPAWGRGRDDAMNLTKYFLIKGLEDDQSTGPTDIPSIWNLKKYQPNMHLNLAGDSHDARSVIIDSSLGVIGARPRSNEEFLKQVDWLVDYLGNYPPPKYPFPIDAAQAAVGKPLYDKYCGSCHDPSYRPNPTVGLVMAGKTDRERLDTWSADFAKQANAEVKKFGIERPGLMEDWKRTGYVSSFLDGIWLRAPYLHNGSVPTMRDLLEPAAARPVTFYRGYNVYDQKKLGFDSFSAEAARIGTLFDTRARAAGNMGHEYGVELTPAEKDALVEYLKTF
jgi:mono/diheme cytochrome c family protein